MTTPVIPGSKPRPIRNKETVGVCSTCPFRRPNQGKPHPSNWYTIANLRRLWNGLRRGIAPGMVCHSTDPEAPTYGSTYPISPFAKPRECGGALFVVYSHFNEVGQTENWSDYTGRHKFPLTKPGLRFWAHRALFCGVPEVVGTKAEEIGLPKCMMKKETVKK